MFRKPGMRARRGLKAGMCQEWKSKASLNTVLGCTFALTRYFFGNDISQSELSEQFGFNRRLLSKYELGTSNVSYSTYLYMFQCLNINSYVSNNILKIIVEQLASQDIYTYLNLENVSLANNEPSTLEKIYVSNSYQYVLDWFGFSYERKIEMEEFKNLQEIEYKELFGIIKSIFRHSKFGTLREKDREAQRTAYTERLKDEYTLLDAEYNKLHFNGDRSLKKELDEAEIQERDLLLERLSNIEQELSGLLPKFGMKPPILGDRESLNFSGLNNFNNDL